MFPYTVRYFCPQSGIQNGLLDFYEDAKETSQDIFNQIVAITEKKGLNLCQISAYGADNASVNYGQHNSVYQKLQHKNSIVMKGNCKCHILHNATKAAVLT